MNCKNCGRKLIGDEIGVNRKMINRNVTSFLCKSCIAEYFGVDEGKIDRKIEQFKANGCLLFVCNDK